jgi:hypothetical protein
MERPVTGKAVGSETAKAAGLERWALSCQDLPRSRTWERARGTGLLRVAKELTELQVETVKVGRASAERNLGLTKGLEEVRASRRQAFQGARLVPRVWLLLRPRRRSWKRRAVARCFKTSSRRWRDNLRRGRRLTERLRVLLRG